MPPEPVVVPAPPAASADAGRAEKPAEPTPASARPEKQPKKPRPNAPSGPGDAPLIEEGPSAASVQAKYQEVAREYAAFKRAYGPRLDAEWNDILDYATYGSGEDKTHKLDSKLNQFRRHVAQAKAGGL
jgi:hypothetical protein